MKKRVSDMTDENRDRIYLTEMSLKELLEGKIIHDDDTLILPPKTDELGIMRIAGVAREDKLLGIIDKQLVHQGKQDQTNYLRGFIKGIQWTKTEIQKMFGR